jgi:serine protease Do
MAGIGIGKRLFAAAAVVGFAALFVVLGVRFSTADEPKVPDLSDLRDAVKAAGKRGENVDEVKKALDALEKSLAKGFTPKPGAGPPAELVALRDAVEAAARKGENVEDIRTQLDAVEKALVGRVLVSPKPVPVQPDPVRPNPRPNPGRFDPGFPQPLPQLEFPQFPDFNPGFNPGGIDREALQKAQDLMRKAMEMRLKDPNNAEALKLMEQAREAMLKAVVGGGGLAMPDFNVGRLPVQDRFRLGVRMEKLTPLVIDQLGIEVGRGIAITDVIAGSAAEKAGFKPHDIVLEFAGKPVSDATEDFNRQVTAVKAGEKVDAVVLRKGKKVELKGIELPEQPRVAPPRLDVRPLPVPAFPNADTLPDLGPKPGVLPGFGDGLPVPNPKAFPGGFGNGNSVTYSVNNGEFTIKANQGGVNYVITGTQEGQDRTISKVTITDGDKTVEAEKLDKVPEQYRPTVEKLLKGGQPRVINRRDR